MAGPAGCRSPWSERAGSRSPRGLLQWARAAGPPPPRSQAAASLLGGLTLPGTPLYDLLHPDVSRGSTSSPRYVKQLHLFAVVLVFAIWQTA